jgi:hypothetical protein
MGKTGDGMIFGTVDWCVEAGQAGRVKPAERQGVDSSSVVWGGRRPVKAWVAAAQRAAAGRGRWEICRRRLRRQGRLPRTGTAAGRGSPSSRRCPRRGGGRWSTRWGPGRRVCRILVMVAGTSVRAWRSRASVGWVWGP